MKLFEKLSRDGLEHHSPPGKDRIGSKSKWKPRVIASSWLLAITILVLFLGGPGFRMIAKSVALKGAKAEGLQGQLKISGSIWSGFAIRDLALDGEKSPIRKVAIKEAKVGYRFGKLVSNFSGFKWLENASITDLYVHLVLPEKEKTPQAKSERAQRGKTPSKKFSPLWHLLSADIALDRLSGRVEVGDKTYQFNDLTLSLPPGKEGQLAIGNLNLPGMAGRESVQIPITKGDRSLSIGAVPLRDNIHLAHLNFGESKPGVFDLDTRLHTAKADLDASYSTGGSARLSLGEGQTLDLGAIIGDRFPLGGRLSTLNVDFTGDPTRPETWKLFGAGQFDSVSWDGFVIDDAGFRIVGENVTVTLERPDTIITVRAHLPLGEMSKPISLDADLAVSSLDSLLHRWAPALPIDGALEGKVSNLQLASGRTILSGKAFLKTRGATWDGQPIDGIEVNADVTRANHIDIAARGALSENNTVNLLGNLNSETLAYDSTGKLNIASDAKLNELLAFFQAGGKFSGTATSDWNGSGNLKSKEHRGNLTLDLPEMTLLKGLPFRGAISAEYDESGASLPKIDLSNDAVKINGTATWSDHRLTIPALTVTDQFGERMKLAAGIPFYEKNLPGDAVNIALETKNLEIASLANFAFSDLPVKGTLTGMLNANGLFSSLSTAAKFDFIPDLKTADENSKLALELNHTGDIKSPSTWDMNLDALMSGLKWKETPLENLSLHIKTIGGGAEKVALATLALDQSSAKMDAKATVGLTRATDFASLAREPIAVDGTILVERIEQLIKDFGGESAHSIPLAGGLSLSLAGLQLVDGRFQKGKLDLKSETMSFAETPVGSLQVNARVTSPDYIEADLYLPLDGLSTAEGSGVYDLKSGGYAGKLSVSADLKSPGKLRSMLLDRNFAQLLPATTSLIWEGKGSVPDKLHLGSFDAKGSDLSLAIGAPPLSFSCRGSYTEDSATIPELSIRSQPLDLKGGLEWKNNELRIPELRGTHSGKEVLHLNASLPLDLKKLTSQLWFQQDGEMALNFTTTDLPLGEMARLFQSTPPVNGTLNTTINAGGSPMAPEISGKLSFSDIVVAQKDKDLPVGRLSVNLAAKGKEAFVRGDYLHPDVKPFAIEAKIPFHPGEWAAGNRKFSDEPIIASAKMDQSSLAFLTSQFPGIEQVAGTVALDVGFQGSLNDPKILGKGAIDVEKLRFANRNAPTFYDIDSAIRFADNSLIIDQFHAIVAGGVVDLSGKALLDGKNPRLDFALKGKEVLVARTPDWNVRTDADLTLSGPWKEARLAGSLGITNSRYFKNVDLMPIGLPSRHRSSLPTLEQTSSGGGRSKLNLDIGVAMEPFKNWPVTVHISTKDPFLIRGNLAQSEVDADLVILGTLGKPVPKGVVKIKEGEVNLPFSKVDVEVGKVVFNEETGFNGALEFKARAKAGDYRINIYAFNRMLEPKYVLTSSPTMPPEDIMTLLATGTTRDEFVGADAGSVAASKAAVLFLKNLKKSSARADREPSLIDQLNDRTELELGKVDPKTGSQTFGGKIRLWKQLFFVGDVDAQSDYRALFKYVFQYR